MRTIVLIAAAMVLASATAQAGDTRSLTTGPDSSVTTTGSSVQQNSAVSQEIKPAVDQRAYNDTPSTGASAPANTARVADTTGMTDTPRYSAPSSGGETKSAGTSTNATKQASSDDTSYHSSSSSSSSYERRARAEYSAYRHGRWTADRVISELHRHGVYW
jgi:hypothetical protein